MRLTNSLTNFKKELIKLENKLISFMMTKELEEVNIGKRDTIISNRDLKLRILKGWKEPNKESLMKKTARRILKRREKNKFRISNHFT